MTSTLRRQSAGKERAGGQSSLLSRAEASSGEPLPDSVQTSFGSQLGTDLGDVRVHTGGASQDAASSMAARAFAVGRDIHFASGEYAPDSESGLRLLAHEVAHTVQQGDARTPQGKLEISQPGDALEREADEVADALVAGRTASVSKGVAGAHQAIFRWATEPPEAVAGRRRVQAAIRAARSPEEINAILAALQEPRESSGIVMIELPGEAEPVPVHDLDLADLIDEAHNHDDGESTAPEDPDTGESTAPDGNSRALDRGELEAMSNEELERELARVDEELRNVEELSPEWSELLDRRRVILDILMINRGHYPPGPPESESDRRARRERRERRRLQNTVPLLEMEVDGDGEASATANPAEFANYVDRRVTSVGFSAYLGGYALYVEGSDQPVFINENMVDLSGGPSQAAGTTVHDSYADAVAAAESGQYAFYRGARGLIAPTVFCEQTTPRVMWGIRDAHRLLSEHVVEEMIGVVIDIVTGRLVELGMAVRSRLRGRRGSTGDADGARGGNRDRSNGSGETDGVDGPPPDREPPGSGGNDGRPETRYAEPDDYALDDGVDLARRRAEWARRPIRVVSSGSQARSAHLRAADEVPNYPNDDFGYACALDLDSGRTAAVATANAPDGVPGGSQALTSAARARGIPIANRNGGHLDALRLTGVDDAPLSEANSGAVAFTAIEQGAEVIQIRLVSGQVNSPIYGRDRPPAAVINEIVRAAQQLFPDRQVIMSAIGRGT